MIYTILAGALEFAEAIDPDGSRPVDIRLLPLTVRDRPIVRLRSLRSLHQRRQARETGRDDHKRSAFAATAVSAQGISVSTARRAVSVASERMGPGVVRTWLRALRKAIPLWQACFSRGAFVGTTFLDLAYSGVLIGDLAASEHLRWVRRGDGRLRPSLGLFLMLVDCVFICELSVTIGVPREAAVFVLEPTYRHAVYQRALQARGCSQIDIKCWEQSGVTITGPHETWRNCYRVARSTRPLSEDDRSKVMRYLDGRLADPPSHIGYLETGHNDNTCRQLHDATGRPVTLAPDRLHAAVFLHSFDDAQYLYGNDGFSDLVAWATFTIDQLLANHAIDQVLIKPHPATWHGWFPNTRRGEQLLSNRYDDQPRVKWLASDASLVALAACRGIVGITHHGSVAEELVHLDVPVIAYRHAAWDEGYHFVRGWSTPDEYRDMLRGLSIKTCSPPTNEEKESLFEYVRECRLVPGRGEFDYFYEFRSWLAAMDDARNQPGREVLAEHLEALSSKEAAQFLDFLMNSTNPVRAVV